MLRTITNLNYAIKEIASQLRCAKEETRAAKEEAEENGADLKAAKAELDDLRGENIELESGKRRAEAQLTERSEARRRTGHARVDDGSAPTRKANPAAPSESSIDKRTFKGSKYNDHARNKVTNPFGKPDKLSAEFVKSHNARSQAIQIPGHVMDEIDRLAANEYNGSIGYSFTAPLVTFGIVLKGDMGLVLWSMKAAMDDPNFVMHCRMRARQTTEPNDDGSMEPLEGFNHGHARFMAENEALCTCMIIDPKNDDGKMPAGFLNGKKARTMTDGMLFAVMIRKLRDAGIVIDGRSLEGSAKEWFEQINATKQTKHKQKKTYHHIVSAFIAFDTCTDHTSFREFLFEMMFTKVVIPHSCGNGLAWAATLSNSCSCPEHLKMGKLDKENKQHEPFHDTLTKSVKTKEEYDMIVNTANSAVMRKQLAFDDDYKMS